MDELLEITSLRDRAGRANEGLEAIFNQPDLPPPPPDSFFEPGAGDNFVNLGNAQRVLDRRAQLVPVLREDPAWTDPEAYRTKWTEIFPDVKPLPGCRLVILRTDRFDHVGKPRAFYPSREHQNMSQL